VPVTPLTPVVDSTALVTSGFDFTPSKAQTNTSAQGIVLDMHGAEDAIALAEEKAVAYAAQTGEFLDPPVYVCDGTKTYVMTGTADPATSRINVTSVSRVTNL
jgi:hypothetical protein